MPTFTYKGLQQDGTSVQGELEAVGRKEALRRIEGLGLRPIRVNEQGATPGSKPAPKPKAPATKAISKPAPLPKTSSNGKAEKEVPGGKAIPNFNFGGKVTAKMLESFTRLLSSLLSSGIPLSRALVILYKEAGNPIARDQWKKIHDRVVDGMSLATAMSQSPETFPKIYVAMVEAGETGGFLDVVLAQIADFQAREKEMKGKVMAAMIYPAILLLLAIAVLIFLLVFFIPKFQDIFKGFGAELPMITQIIVGVSEVVRHYGLFLLAGIVGLGFTLRTWFTSEKGRRVWEDILLKLPMIGPLVAQFAMARFCRMLGTLLGAGVPLINGLNVARRSIGNQILTDAVSNSIERVKEGKQLGASLGECRALFVGSTIEMISVAEESGRLDVELLRIANVTEGDLDRQLKTTVALAEPLMLFMIAAFVGTIFIGMVIPIFSLQDHIK
ncbi:MAG: hypothetical protein JWN25_2706 [Verrucomicrobiales bacterium]|nr:hypothetical protein [Verrucomicrobiales bacterium]